MSGEATTSSYVRFGEGPDRVTWPHPDDPTEVEWRLRYGDKEGAALTAASYVAAYRYLIDMPQRKRNKVVAEIRAAAAVVGGSR
jgi:hypothetical protein